MRIRSIVAALAMALGFFGVAATANADKIVTLELGVAPPAERVEVVPAPRQGYIYERGHYVVEGNTYVWHEGRFIKEREGHRFEPAIIEHRGNVYVYRSGHWDDDLD